MKSGRSSKNCDIYKPFRQDSIRLMTF